MLIKSEILTTAVKLNQSYSSFEFDMRELFNSGSSNLLNEIADNLWSQIKHHKPKVIFGKGIGCYPLLVALKLKAYYTDNVNLVVLFIRDSRKEKGGFRKIVEGAEASTILNEKAVFIDDIYNSGSTFKNTKQTLFNEGFVLDVCARAVAIDFCSRNIEQFAEIPLYNYTTRKVLGITREDSHLPKILQNVKWEIIEHFKEGNEHAVKSTSVIDNDKIYLGSDNTHFYCYDLLTGKNVWTYESAKPETKGSSGLAAIDKKCVYWTAYDGIVRCANKLTGEHKWSTKVDRYVHSSICLDQENDRLFVGTEWRVSFTGYGVGDIVCLNSKTGIEIWRTPTKDMVPCSPAYLKEQNLLVCGSNDFHLYFLNASNGEILHKTETKGEVKGKPIFSEDLTKVLVCTNTGHVYCIELSTFKTLWHRHIGVSSPHCFPIVENGNMYVTNSKGFVICISIESSMIVWVCQLRNPIGWSIINTKSCLVVGTTFGHIVTIDKLTGKKLSSDLIKDGFIFQKCVYDEATNSLIVPTNKDLICYDIKL